MRSSRSPLWLAALTVVVPAAIGCAPIQEPRSMELLGAALEGGDTGDAQKYGKPAMDEARRYLELATDALDEGDSEDAERLAALGMIQYEIAMAALVKAGASHRLEEAAAKEREMEAEISRIEDRVERIRGEEERAGIRSHLLKVVDSTMLKAASREEALEQGLSTAQKEEIEKARAQVARQILGRARMGLELCRSLVSMKVLEEERILPVEGALELARQRSEKGELAGVQEYAEKLWVEVGTIRSRLWDDGEEEALAGLGRRLSGEGIDGTMEEGSLVVDLGATRGASVSKARELGEKLRGEDNLMILVVASAPGDRAGESVERQTREKARAAAEAISGAGVSSDRVFSYGAGSTRPSAILSGKKGSAVAILIPLPVSR